MTPRGRRLGAGEGGVDRLVTECVAVGLFR
jgi:hypothetical protein